MNPLLFILYVAVGVFFLYAWSKIFSRAGYSPWMCLLLIIPIINLIVFLIFAFGRWPIEDRVTVQKSENTLPF